MESLVSGKITKSNRNAGQVRNQLQDLGYTVNETSDHLEFEKEELLENVIGEVTPICQSAGVNEEKELTLEETYPDLAMSSCYDHGRIVRKLPSF